jgi:lysine decarboxylase
VKDKIESQPTYAAELCRYVEEDKTLYCMPGHKQGKGAPEFLKKIWGKDIFQYDLTEVRGSDVLSYPKRELSRSQHQAAEIMGAQRSWFLVNGSSIGVYAALTALVVPGEKVLIHRACHKSIVTGLVLSGSRPIYIDSTPNLPEYAYGGVDFIRLEELLKEHNIKLCFFTSPNYYGAALDIEKISHLCHKHNAILLVDEAHGAHFCLNENLPHSALETGADYVVHSMHKTLGGLYQCGILHSNTSCSALDEKVDSVLSMLQSTSPSALFLMSIDAALSDAKNSGKKLYEILFSFLNDIRPQLNGTSFRVIEPNEKQMIEGGFIGLDPSKIIFENKSGLNVNLIKIKQELSLNYNTEIELTDEKHLLVTLTMADALNIEETRDRLRSFSCLIEELSQKQACRPNKEISSIRENVRSSITTEISPRDAFYTSKKKLSLSKAEGKISGDLVCIYPPGCPIVIPGERLDLFTIEKIYHKQKLGFNVIGVREIDKDLVIGIIEEGACLK